MAPRSPPSRLPVAASLCRFTEPQIVVVLKEAEASVTVAELARKHTSKSTYFKRKSRYAEVTVSDVRRLK